jgi:hypothetical protein
MAKLVQSLDSRLTLAQHREVLVLAGRLALLVGCVEYDMRDARSAEVTEPGILCPTHLSGSTRYLTLDSG